MEKPEPKVRPWKILSSEMALDEPWMRIRRDKVQLPSGKIVDDYFLWESPQIVMCVPVTPDGRFVLERQYRHAVGQILLQFGAGAAEKGEKLEVAAARELEEETGYVTQQPLIYLGGFMSYATKLTGNCQVYLAQDATPAGKRVFDDQEETEVVLMTPAELLDYLSKPALYPSDLLAATLLATRHLGIS